jgi:methyl-accepting chemotaxis protein
MANSRFQSIGVKVLALVVGALILQAAFTFFFFSEQLDDFSDDQLQQYRRDFFQKESEKLKNYVELAYTVVESYYERSQDVETLKKDALKQVKPVVDAVVHEMEGYYADRKDVLYPDELKENIKSMTSWARFAGGNYIWINDTGPTMVMHPIKPSLDGKDLSGFQDPDGVYLFNEMVEAVQSGGSGAVSYMWTKPGEEEPKPKISYVRLMPELDWIFGAGAWIEDITGRMKAQAKDQVAEMRLGASGYFWINDDSLPKPRMVMHPTVPSLNGKRLEASKFNCATRMRFGADGEWRETDGKKNLFQAMVEVSREAGEGYVIYNWPKPKEGGGVTDAVYPKLSYVKLFKPWGWVIGMGQYIDNIDTAIQQQEARFEKTLSGIMGSMVLYGLIILALVAVISVVVLRRNLMKPLGALVGFSRRVSEGDLDYRPQARFRGEMAELNDAMVSMVDSLEEKIKESGEFSDQCQLETERAREAVQQADEARKQAETARQAGLREAADRLESLAENLSSASEELSAQVEQVSRGADEQRKSTEQTATSMEEMNATVLEVARSAASAAESSDHAKDNAQNGARIVQDSVKAINRVYNLTEDLRRNMGELGGQAEAIGEVMNVITDIADQTNLLALNAAIEAARAGEAGRGFAVVADEVRKLAEKTMSATKEVGEAITAIQENTKRNVGNMDQAAQAVEEATQLVNDSGDSLQKIVDNVEGAADQVRSIATASEQQSTSSEEISRAVEDISRISSETAQGMHQAEDAIQELARLAADLTRLVGRLREE